ncbi:MAG: N-acetylmuramoyl-L-alanine amidase [Candidatus Omnitrophica bacterium]|nr:N-acetylmuramoyl-L-alanine amidase [Candidatus Omnitrophota bacterium]
MIPQRCSIRPILLSALLGLLSAGCAATGPSISGTPPPGPIPPTRPITIVIDAGHGGHDPGASYFGLQEKSLALDVAKRLHAQLQQAGVLPIMTREADAFIPLNGRPAVANRLQAGLFVSIHLNANRNSGVSGAEVYYPRESVISASATLPPWIPASGTSIASMEEKRAVWEHVLRRSRSQSRRLAGTLCRSMRQGLGVPCRGGKAARFVVLREAWMPAVLVEVGYMSNPVEAQRLASAEYRQAAAEAIAEGILEYVREQGLQHI